MSEGKHTPGPYEIGKHGILNEDGEALFVTGGDGTVWWQNAADAHLLAAAPEMFVALKRAVAQLERLGFDGEASGANAALAKAEAQP